MNVQKFLNRSTVFCYGKIQKVRQGIDFMIFFIFQKGHSMRTENDRKKFSDSRGFGKFF